MTDAMKRALAAHSEAPKDLIELPEDGHADCIKARHTGKGEVIFGQTMKSRASKPKNGHAHPRALPRTDEGENTKAGRDWYHTSK